MRRYANGDMRVSSWLSAPRKRSEDEEENVL